MPALRAPLVVAVLLLGPGSAFLGGLSGAAAAAGCPDSSNAGFFLLHGDVDGDGGPDAVVGQPRRGSVAILYGDGSRQQVTAAEVGASTAARFGAAVTTADLDGDACVEVVIGSPAERAVYVLHGGADGVATSGALRIAAPGDATDGFGSAVSAADGALFVGAPLARVAGLADAGQVHRYEVGASGAILPGVVYSYANLPGAVQAGNHFGEVLSGDSVGVPRRRVTGHPDAGEVVRLAALPARSTRVGQATAGIPGAPETGDQLGAAVADEVIGVPGEDIGRVRDAGAVLLVPTHRETWTLGLWHQGSRGMPGALRAGNRFGAAVAVGMGLSCPELDAAVVGVPRDDVHGVQDAGSVIVFDDLGIWPDCPRHVLHEPAGPAGGPEAGDRFGARVAAYGRDPLFEEDGVDRLLVGAPGEHDRAGAIFSPYTTSTPPSAGQRFGDVLARG